MNNTTIIQRMAKAICEHGTCSSCDEDCVDYRAAKRAFDAYARSSNQIVEDFENKLRGCYSAPMYQKPGAHTMIIKLFANIEDVKKEMTMHND